MRAPILVAVFGVSALAVGCSDRALGGGEDSGGESTGAETAGTVTASEGSAGPTSATTLPPTTTTDTGDMTTASETSGSFIYGAPDAGTVICDIWAQDCLPGLKCMPWANDGGSAWNATKCAPVDPNPKPVGDTCYVDGNGATGIDDCDVASMCWDVNDENMGTCVGFCWGTQANPQCQVGHSCLIANDGVLILCLPDCDPLMQDCPQGQVCHVHNGEIAVCVPDYSGATGQYGDACLGLATCDPGLLCILADSLPSCQDDACCSPYCDVNAPNTCPDANLGMECVALLDNSDVGVCALPP